MAEVLVSAVVEVLIQKLLSGELFNFAPSEEINAKLNKWKDTLGMIKAVLADAGQKEIQEDGPVKLWLIKLQDLAYDIDDVLDDIATEVMKRKLNREASQTSATTSTRSKLLGMLPTCCTNYTPHNIMYGRKMSSNLDEITTRLTHLFEQRKSLGLKLNVKVESPDRTGVRYHQTSLIDVSKVLGRDGDKEALLGKLLGDEEACSNQNVISIVSIVGMGGIGKTTLARLVYNDQQVNDHFELKAWVCVSDYFVVLDISKKIYQAVVGYNQDFADLDLLQVALKERLSKKRFLLVLDDVWNEDHDKWELLERPLLGAPGSKIVVTTRNTAVASVMNSVQPHKMRVLSNEYAMSLFAKYALDDENFDKHPSLVSIARGIIEKCDGLPLALIALGRVLKNKGNDEWEELLNSEIWSLKDENNILPALKLSYYDLPPHLKQLVAYCSFFPKDYEFEKNEMVLLWMAEGFLSRSKSMEKLGCEYFEQLQSRFFFQQIGNDETKYTMHDLMHDLAISVAGDFFLLLDDKEDSNDRNEGFEKLRHFSFFGERRTMYEKFKELYKARSLRTFLPVVSDGSSWPKFISLDSVLVELLTRLVFLRVLSLTHSSIEKVPQSIGSLKHLRYLNFSSTNIKQIPEQVSKLYNLQSLLVRDCRQLCSLPVSFVKLINLRHLDMTNTPSLKKLPLRIGGLTSLQTLSKVIIEGGNGFKVSELKGLKDLQGGLYIEGLEKVTDSTQANHANLQQKTGLEDLCMEWSDGFDDSRDPVIEYEVLERLRAPHSNLKKLKITGYGGRKFPNWVGDPSFDQLTELVLSVCENCTDLPITLGHLSSLRKLCLSSMKAVKTVGFELPFHGNAFPSLESLEVYDMQCLEIWSTSGGDNAGTPRSFPSLGVISIKRCRKLAKVSFGLVPSLKDLNVEGCPEAVFRDIVGVSSSIRRLKLDAIKGLTQLDREVLNHLGALEDLIIWNCDELRYLWESESEASWCKKLESMKGEKEVVNVGSNIMGSLRKVDLWNCEALESYCCPNSVESLVIMECDSMISLSFSKLQEEEDLPSSSSSSSNLKFLWISNCKNIKSISQAHLQSLTSLEDMLIYNCPSMEDSFPSCGWLWPPKLRKLIVGELKKPMSEWGLQHYPPSLVQLSLHGKNSGIVSFGIMEEQEDHNNTTSSAACFLLPPSLTELWIYDFEEVESVSEVLQHLPHHRLNIYNCPKLRDVPASTSSLKVIVTSL